MHAGRIPLCIDHSYDSFGRFALVFNDAILPEEIESMLSNPEFDALGHGTVLMHVDNLRIEYAFYNPFTNTRVLVIESTVHGADFVEFEEDTDILVVEYMSELLLFQGWCEGD